MYQLYWFALIACHWFLEAAILRHMQLCSRNRECCEDSIRIQAPIYPSYPVQLVVIPRYVSAVAQESTASKHDPMPATGFVQDTQLSSMKTSFMHQATTNIGGQ